MADEQMEAAQAKVAVIENCLMRDAVRKEAVANGILDPSDIDHISLDGLAFGPNGTVSGAKELVQSLRNSKSHWFKNKGMNAPRLPDSVKPGSKEHRQAERDFLQRWAR